MKGSDLHRILKDNKIIIKDLARLLSISSQALNQLFKAKDVKSGVLERIAEVLGRDMGMFYMGIESVITKDELIALYKENTALRQEIERLNAKMKISIVIKDGEGVLQPIKGRTLVKGGRDNTTSPKTDKVDSD